MNCVQGACREGVVVRDCGFRVEWLYACGLHLHVEVAHGEEKTEKEDDPGGKQNGNDINLMMMMQRLWWYVLVLDTYLV